jgi:hypothetical protein
MPQPVWRKVVNEMRVPGSKGMPWTLVLEYPNPNKLMKIEVVVDTARTPPVSGEWRPLDFGSPCSADGDFDGTANTGTQRGTPLITSAAVGALIGRIGGGTADKLLAPPPGTASATSAGPFGCTVGFAVGRTCIFTVPVAPTGGLFLGVNDTAERMVGVTDFLIVNIYEAV